MLQYQIQCKTTIYTMFWQIINGIFPDPLLCSFSVPKERQGSKDYLKNSSGLGKKTFRNEKN